MRQFILLFLLLLVVALDAGEYRTIQRNTTIKAKNGATHRVGDFGNYYALLIYVEEYRNLKNLRTPKKDVEDIAKILKDRYGFIDTKIVPNPKNSDALIEVLDNFKNRLNSSDNLLIYYAGHGSKNGYWQLSDAKQRSRVGWISVKEAINQTLKEMRSKHILVVADSCYSEFLTRDGVSMDNLSPNDKRYYSKLYAMKSRNVLTSGGLQPVLDQDPTNPNHSVFANGFLKMLQKNSRAIFSLEEQYPKVKRYVRLNSEEQIPLYGDVKLTGHEDGGDFIFLDRKSMVGDNGHKEEYHLTINTTPLNATVQILNIQPRYRDDMLLKKGLYKIRVFANGYKEQRFNITLKKDTQHNIVLEKVAQGVTTIDGLMYQNQPFTKEYTWQEAKKYCSNLTLGGYNNWRLPTRAELMKLGNIELYNWDNYDNWKKWFDKNKHRRLTGSKGKKRFVRQEFLENMQTANFPWFWTSEEKDSSSAWVAFFHVGDDLWFKHSVTGYALCVR